MADIKSTVSRMTTGGMHKEGRLTRKIEEQTAQFPSGLYLGFAVGSIVLSAALAAFSERKAIANFVGLWAPTFLVLGIYNKLVKLEGSERFPGERGEEHEEGEEPGAAA